ncbi:MAG TPA: hypothetical protein VK966_11970, partial [Longimicrobiales bacterium]|nr:hypothetical protein [Longimicrobiales bacterium]
AAESGGNCSLTRPDETVDHGGVRIVGIMNPASAIPRNASQMYSKNVQELLFHLLERDAPTDGAAATGAPRLVVDLDDEITAACCVTHAGEVVNERTRVAMGDVARATPE